MWNFTSKLRQLVVRHNGLDSYSLPPLKDLVARKELCEKLTAKTFPFVWATLTVRSISILSLTLLPVFPKTRLTLFMTKLIIASL